MLTVFWEVTGPSTHGSPKHSGEPPPQFQGVALGADGGLGVLHGAVQVAQCRCAGVNILQADMLFLPKTQLTAMLPLARPAPILQTRLKAFSVS